jgi:hypothetical protein
MIYVYFVIVAWNKGWNATLPFMNLKSSCSFNMYNSDLRLRSAVGTEYEGKIWKRMCALEADH